MTESCATCRWFAALPGSVHRAYVDGHCRRYPPARGPSVTWPATLDDLFCGEWTSKGQGEEEL